MSEGCSTSLSFFKKGSSLTNSPPKKKESWGRGEGEGPAAIIGQPLNIWLHPKIVLGRERKGGEEHLDPLPSSSFANEQTPTN